MSTAFTSVGLQLLLNRFSSVPLILRRSLWAFVGRHPLVIISLVIICGYIQKLKKMDSAAILAEVNYF